jgi:hypothetical protein
VAICAEGRDDVQAIRALLKAMGLDRDPSVPPLPPAPQNREASRVEYYRKGQVRLQLQSVEGKPNLAPVALDLAKGSASRRPAHVIVSFDPDGDPPAGEFDFFLKAARVVPPHPFIPAPWRSSAPVFDGLPDHQCLERVLIGGLLRSPAADRFKAWAESATSGLLSLDDAHAWKRAFRIWAAALTPRTESFVDGLLSSSSGAKDECLAALQATPVQQLLTQHLT